jgi:DNA repair exonuclease SbcCD ATPase subunit
MRITRIRLADFKRHHRLDIEPSPGMTIIRGPNEAGKSSIQKALELVLFRKADANRGDVRQAYSWGSSEPPAVTLDFEVGGVSGTLSKRFAGQQAEAELLIDAESIGDYSLIQDRIAELTGIPSEGFFRATASVGHAELSEVGGDEPIIQDRLQKAISGADRGTGQAKKKLSAAIHRYRTEGHKNPGLLKVLREEIAMLEGELATGEAALARLEADRATWVEADERRAALDGQLRLQTARLEEAQRAVSLAIKRDEAQERYDRYKRATELEEQAARLQSELPTAMPLPQLRANVTSASSLEMELSEVGATLDAEADTREGDSADPAAPPPRPARWLGLAMGTLAAAVVAWLVLGGGIGAVAAVLLGIGTVGLLIGGLRAATRRRQHGLAQQLAEAAAAELHEADRERQESYRRLRREFEALLAKLEVPDVSTAEALLARAEEHTDELLQIEGELRGLGVQGRSLRRLGETRDEAANEAEQAKHALAAMGVLGEDPASERRTAQRLVERTTPARDEARSEADQARGRIDANPVDAEIVAGLAERLAAGREQLTLMQQRMLVYQGTLAAIEAAEQATLKTAARYLEERMGPTISRMTEGRYDEIEVDEKTLAFQVRVPETGELVTVDELSQGTADQLFLAARLGLVRLVTMDRRPPLILDDPFVTFDGQRADRALRLVKEVAAEQGFQVLFLTCSDRFDALADKLVVLPGPSTDRVLAAPARPRPADVETAAEVPQPTLQFEPDPRPNPDPVAPVVPRTADPESGVPDLFEMGSDRQAGAPD